MVRHSREKKRKGGKDVGEKMLEPGVIPSMAERYWGVSVLEGGLELGFGVRGLDFWRNGAGGGDQVGW